jgi:hypothetical protein
LLQVAKNGLSEASLQRTLRDEALQATSLYFHDADSRRNQAGFPDTFIGLRRQNLLLVPELKSASGLAEFYRLLDRVKQDPSILVKNSKALKSQRQQLWVEFLSRQPTIISGIVGPEDLDRYLRLLRMELTASRQSP